MGGRYIKIADRKSLDDHVDSIIKAKGPKGSLSKRYQPELLKRILARVHKRGELLDLRHYHFPGAIYVWRNKQGKLNWEIIRGAVGELIQTLIAKYKWSFEELVRKIHERHFETEPIKYNRTLGGLIDGVFNGSAQTAVLDWLRHAAPARLRKKHKHIKPWHFKVTGNRVWFNKNGKVNFENVWEALDEFAFYARKQNKWTWDDFATQVTVKHTKTQLIRYGANIGTLIWVFPGTFYEMIYFYFQNHKQKDLKKKFKGLRPHHIKNPPLEVSKDVDFHRQVAREAIGELCVALMKNRKWSKNDLIQKIDISDFKTERIKYGKILGAYYIFFYGKENRPSLIRGVHDALLHHESKGVRVKFEGLKIWHFPDNPFYLSRNKDSYDEIFQEAMTEFYQKITKARKWSDEDFYQKVQIKDFFTVKLSFDSTLEMIMRNIRFIEAPSKAAFHFLQNHPDKRIRQKWKKRTWQYARKYGQKT